MDTIWRYPIGVIGGITPFNFPMMIPFWMFPLAIAMGNSFVLKPSEKTPLLTEKLADLRTSWSSRCSIQHLFMVHMMLLMEILDHPEIQGYFIRWSKPVGEICIQTWKRKP